MLCRRIHLQSNKNCDQPDETSRENHEDRGLQTCPSSWERWKRSRRASPYRKSQNPFKDSSSKSVTSALRQLVCDNLDLVLERFIDHLDEPQGVIWKAGHIGHGKGSVVWLKTCLGKNNNLDKCLNYKWNIPGVVDLYRHYLCFRNYIYNF